MDFKKEFLPLCDMNPPEIFSSSVEDAFFMLLQPQRTDLGSSK